MATTSLESRVTGTETSIKYLKSDLSKTKLNLAEVEEKSNTLENDVRENKSKIADNTSRIKDLEKAQEDTNVDMRLMKTSQSNINEDIVDLAKHIEDVDENTTNLEKKHTEDLTEVKDELVNLYEGIIRVEDKIEENKNNCNCNSHDHHHHHKPDHTCNCPYCEGSEEKEEPVIPSTASIMDKLVAKYLKEHINDLFCTIIPRHDISTNWTLNDPILTLGEYGVEDDTHRIKRGDGTSKWSELPYETFGIDKLVPTSASDVSYSNVETGLEKNNVQEMLDFLVETDVAFSKKLDKKEDIGNRRTDLDNEDNDHYPTTKAVVDYVTDRLKNIDIGGGTGDGNCLPDTPDEEKDFVLHNNKGTVEWVEPTSENGLPNVDDTTKDYTLQNIQGETKWVENEEATNQAEQFVFYWDGKSSTENPDNLELWNKISKAVYESNEPDAGNRSILVLSRNYVFPIRKGEFNFGSVVTRTVESQHLVDNEVESQQSGYLTRIIRWASVEIELDCTGGKHEVTNVGVLEYKTDTMDYLSTTKETQGLYMPTKFQDPTTKYYVDDKVDTEKGKLQQQIDDQQDEINTLKSNLKALQDKFDSLIDLNEEEF